MMPFRELAFMSCFPNDKALCHPEAYDSCGRQVGQGFLYFFHFSKEEAHVCRGQGPELDQKYWTESSLIKVHILVLDPCSGSTDVFTL